MKYVTINSHVIRANAKHGRNDPPIRIAMGLHDREPEYAHEVSFDGPCELVYSPDKPLMKCGARMVLKTAHAVRVFRNGVGKTL